MRGAINKVTLAGAIFFLLPQIVLAAEENAVDTGTTAWIAYLDCPCFADDSRIGLVLWGVGEDKKCVGHDDAQFCGNGHSRRIVDGLWLFPHLW